MRTCRSVTGLGTGWMTCVTEQLTRQLMNQHRNQQSQLRCLMEEKELCATTAAGPSTGMGVGNLTSLILTQTSALISTMALPTLTTRPGTLLHMTRGLT